MTYFSDYNLKFNIEYFQITSIRFPRLVPADWRRDVNTKRVLYRQNYLIERPCKVMAPSGNWVEITTYHESATNEVGICFEHNKEFFILNMN